MSVRVIRLLMPEGFKINNLIILATTTIHVGYVKVYPTSPKTANFDSTALLFNTKQAQQNFL